MTRVGETQADDLFRQDAYNQGYLEDAHAPGNGRGLRAYYRDNGMVQPQEEKEILKGKGEGRPGKEITGLDVDGSGGPNAHCPSCYRKAFQLRGTNQ